MDKHDIENIILLKSLNFEYVNPVNANLLCPICRLPLLNPVATQCGHTFCKECIQSSLEVSDKCPCDRKKINEDEFNKVDRLILNILNELEIYCPNKINGCPIKCQRQFLYQHYPECKYELIECPYTSCDKKIIKKDLKDHLKTCDYKEMECEFCHEKYFQKDKTEHISKCKEFSKANPSLKDDVIIHCKYKNFGCSWEDKAGNMKEHEKNCLYHQFEGFFENVYLKNQRQLEAENSELKKKVYQLTDEITFLKAELDKYKNSEIASQQQAINENMVELKNDVVGLKYDMQNTYLNINEMEMRYMRTAMEEKIRMEEELESLRNSVQSVQFQVLSFMKFIKENPSFTMLSKNNGGGGSNTNKLTSTRDEKSKSFISPSYNSSKLIKSVSSSSNKSSTTNGSTNGMLAKTSDFYNFNFNPRSRQRSNSDTDSCSEIIRKERRFSKI